MKTIEKECHDCGAIYTIEYENSEEDNYTPLFCPFCSTEDSPLDELSFDKK